MDNEKKSPYITPGQTFGRPSFYTDELADRMCQVISKDGRAVGTMCKEIDWFPSKDTFYEWLNTHAHFSDAYSRAKRAQAEIRLENVQELIDSGEQDFREHGGRLYNNNSFCVRLRTGAGFAQWRAAKLLGEVYGDKKVEEKFDELKEQVCDAILGVQRSRDKL